MSINQSIRHKLLKALAKPKNITVLLEQTGARSVGFQTRYGLIDVPINSGSIIQEFFRRGYYQEDIVKRFLSLQSESKQVLNIGANIGTAARIIAASKRYRQVHLFEPSKDNFEVLKRNMRDYPNVILINCALGAKDEIRALNLNKKSIGRHSFATSFGAGKEEVVVQAADGFLRLEENRTPFDVFMDVEGWEIEVLKGFGETLERCSILALEWNGQIHELNQINIFVDILISSGFRSAILLSPSSPIVRSFTELIKSKKQLDVAFVKESCSDISKNLILERAPMAIHE